MNPTPCGKSYIKAVLKAGRDARDHVNGKIEFESLPLLRFKNTNEQEFYEQCFWEYLRQVSIEKSASTGGTST